MTVEKLSADKLENMFRFWKTGGISGVADTIGANTVVKTIGGRSSERVRHADEANQPLAIANDRARE